jgi:hypothetical protein
MLATTWAAASGPAQGQEQRTNSFAVAFCVCSQQFRPVLMAVLLQCCQNKNKTRNNAAQHLKLDA